MISKRVAALNPGRHLLLNSGARLLRRKKSRILFVAFRTHVKPLRTCLLGLGCAEKHGPAEGDRPPAHTNSAWHGSPSTPGTKPCAFASRYQPLPIFDADASIRPSSGLACRLPGLPSAARKAANVRSGLLKVFRTVRSHDVGLRRKGRDPVRGSLSLAPAIWGCRTPCTLHKCWSRSFGVTVPRMMENFVARDMRIEMKVAIERAAAEIAETFRAVCSEHNRNSGRH